MAVHCTFTSSFLGLLTSDSNVAVCNMGLLHPMINPYVVVGR